MPMNGTFHSAGDGAASASLAGELTRRSTGFPARSIRQSVPGGWRAASHTTSSSASERLGADATGSHSWNG